LLFALGFILIILFYSKIIVWDGANKSMSKIRGAVKNYLWFGKENLTRSRVSWKELFMNKKYGGLELVDPKAAKTNILCKCIVKVMEFGGVKPPTHA